MDARSRAMLLYQAALKAVHRPTTMSEEKFAAFKAEEAVPSGKMLDLLTPIVERATSLKPEEQGENYVFWPDEEKRPLGENIARRITLGAWLKTFDWLVVSSSAGKDSQVALEVTAKLARDFDLMDRLVVVHADLMDVEWVGTKELAAEQARRWGARYEETRREIPRSSTFFDYAENMRAGYLREGKLTYAQEKQHKAFFTEWLAKGLSKAAIQAKWSEVDPRANVWRAGRWPNEKLRWCTSEFKRGPILRVFTKLGDEWREREKKRIVAERREKNALLFPGARLSRKEEEALEKVPRQTIRPCRILDIEGLRAQESTGREKQPVLMYREDASSEVKEVWRWLPVHRFSTDDIWDWIRRSGVPFHPAYSAGLERLSCVFCLYAPPYQLQTAGKVNRALLRRYVEKEEKYGMAFHSKVSLKQIEEDIVAGKDYEKSGVWGDCAPQL